VTARVLTADITVARWLGSCPHAIAVSGSYLTLLTLLYRWTSLPHLVCGGHQPDLILPCSVANWCCFKGEYHTQPYIRRSTNRDSVNQAAQPPHPNWNSWKFNKNRFLTVFTKIFIKPYTKVSSGESKIPINKLSGSGVRSPAPTFFWWFFFCDDFYFFCTEIHEVTKKHKTIPKMRK